VKADAFNGQLDSLILAIVAEEPGHGYVILQRLRERSTGVFELAEGSLYPALHRLERDGLLASSWSADGGRYPVCRSGHPYTDPFGWRETFPRRRLVNSRTRRLRGNARSPGA